MHMSENLELTDLIRNWLSEHMPEWKVIIPKKDELGNHLVEYWAEEYWYPKDAIGAISYVGEFTYMSAFIYSTKVEFVYNYGSSSGIKTKNKSPMDRGLVLDAHMENFLPLLSNRLYMMGLGFKTAIESRERNKRHSDNQGVPS